MSKPADFVSRLAILMAHYQLSASALADAIGVQRSGISHLVSGRNKPGLDFILKLHERFPEVDLYWLLKGEGAFLRGEADKTGSPAATPALADSPSGVASLTNETDELIVLYPDGTYRRFQPK